MTSEFSSDSLSLPDDVSILDQDLVWLEPAGLTWLIEDLTAEQLVALIDLLVTNASFLYLTALEREVASVVAAREAGTVSGDELSQILGVPTAVDLEPAEWLLCTPLVRALRRRLHRGAEYLTIPINGGNP